MRLEAVTECEHGYDVEHEIIQVTKPSVRWSCPGGSRRVASTSDLIEELKARGAFVDATHFDEHHMGPSIGVSAPGRYLVLSLEGGKP